ncbi:YccT family protein [Ferrimonas kyonanensis]|uniref:YccT family protein n=1 Tax=Ferrimonas kyonanensis TaxID=364763 RepID=UPI00040D149C|nr:DUF2057 domain-containing protein [Ferrimonas kyonanensis]
MNKASVLAAMIAGGMSFGSLAAELTIPLSFEFIAVNGQEVKSNFFSHKDEIELEKGQHTIALVYKDLVEEPFGDGHQRVSSDPFLLHITIDSDGEYKVRPHEVIRDLDQAKAFAQKPVLNVTQENGQAVTYKVEMTSVKQETLFDTLNKGLSPEQEAKKKVIAATAPGAVVATGAAQPSVNMKGDDVTNPQMMLKYWWQQADEKTRKDFMSWAIQNM